MNKHTLSSSPLTQPTEAATALTSFNGWLTRVETAFANWQAARLQTLSPTRLWDKAMQDSRSPVEIRKQQR